MFSKKMEIKPKLQEEIADLYNQIYDKYEESGEIDETLKNNFREKINATKIKEIIAKFKEAFDEEVEDRPGDDKCLASKKKVTKKTKESNSNFEVNFSDFGRFLSRFLPPISIKYSRTTKKETVTEEIIEDDATDRGVAPPYGFKI